MPAAKILGHPIHPMLIVFPIGLLGMSVIFDLIGAATGDYLWSGMAYYMIGAGLLSGLAAAIFGVIDWLGLPSDTRAKRVGLRHAISNAAALGLFFWSWRLRYDAPPAAAAYWLSALGMAMLLVGGWLGGELVDRLGVGVDDGAHLNAPSSLSGRPAREQSADRSGIGRAANF